MSTAESTDEELIGHGLRPVVLEVSRSGRRPRYHRAARTDTGTLLEPEQCNLDQVALVITELDELPEGIKRPWSQLCRRCWRGLAVYDAALHLRDVMLGRVPAYAEPQR